MAIHTFKLKRHSFMIEWSQEEKQTCFPHSPFFSLGVHGSPHPSPAVLCLLSGQIQFTEPAVSNAMRKNWIFPTLGVALSQQRVCGAWQLAQGRGLGYRWEMQVAEGRSAVRMYYYWGCIDVLLHGCIAEPLPLSPLGPMSSGSPEKALLSPVSTGQGQTCQVLACRAVRSGSQSAL